MKKTLLLFLIWMSVQPLFMQNSQVTVELQETVLGHYVADSSAFPSTELIFTKSVYRVSMSPEKNLLIVELRDIGKGSKLPKMTGLVVVYDLTHKTTLWSKKLDFPISQISLCSDKLLLSSNPETKAFDLNAGNKLWRTTDYLYDVYPEKNIAFIQHDNKIGMLNLETGKRLWLSNLNNRNGLNDFFLYEDSMLMIVSDGLHVRNIYNGQGWDFDMRTSKTDYAPAVIGSVLGVLFTALTGSDFIETEPTRITDMISNVCYDNHSFYFAGREKLVSMSEDGTLNWTIALPKNSASQSSLIVNAGSLFMLNRGFAYENGGRIPVGIPYLACYDRKSSEKRYFMEVAKENMILDWVLHADVMALLTDFKIMSLHMNDGLAINENPVELNKRESVVGFVNPKLCKAMKDSLWNNLVDISPDHYFVLTNQDRVLEYGADLQLLQSFSANDLYIEYFDNPDLRFIAKGNHSIVISNLGDKVAEIPANERSFVVGNSLITFDDNKVKIIDLHKLQK